MSLWSRLFGRKPKPSTDKPNWLVRDTWRTGDLGVCLGHASGWRLSGKVVDGPDKGDTIRVLAVHMFDGDLYLELVGFDGHFEAGCFRKVVQQQDEACDPAFAELVKRNPVKA